MACSGQQQRGGENEWHVSGQQQRGGENEWHVSGQQQHGGENEWRVVVSSSTVVRMSGV